MKKWIPILIIALVVPFAQGCYKGGDTVAKVIVVSNSDGSPINGATVIIDPDNEALENKPELMKEGTTNSAGEASFNYNDSYRRGQAGLFVLDVRVEAIIDGVPTVGEGVIKIEEETTSETTIEM